MQGLRASSFLQIESRLGQARISLLLHPPRRVGSYLCQFARVLGLVEDCRAGRGQTPNRKALRPGGSTQLSFSINQHCIASNNNKKVTGILIFYDDSKLHQHKFILLEIDSAEPCIELNLRFSIYLRLSRFYKATQPKIEP